MCTSILMNDESGASLFGRNMDLYYDLDTSVVITPRNFPFEFRRAGALREHYALIGMAMVKEGYPLYCEAANERGLAVSGLDFPGNALYPEEMSETETNVSPFEVVPWILSQCADVDEAETLLGRTHIIAVPFSPELPLSPLHWHIADGRRSIVFEVTAAGQRIFDDNANVMTNNPTFDFHMENLAHYVNLTVEQPQNKLENIGTEPFSFGLGSFGLPGDFSSASRFVKAAYLLRNSACGEGEMSRVSQFFHLLGSVAMVRGGVITPGGNYDITSYSCCIDLKRGIYYYTTYENSRIRAVRLRDSDIKSSRLIDYSIDKKQDVEYC